ncbi:hypothetical protein MIMGU_mgv1a010240mg [Erythranthe guttata]|uniref:RING-type domain-containing protein n=1 Tax=Erythranthe guttata TaxID=4155 RepID=A0A022R9J0_ERYGU|nr:PREDICTED: E3 ubiquitin ligase BIG BROTHER-related [Erythranthe guttata]EYU35575.1 hypothetical protein MIMGU_mgv1a010240mg [Erythranthe guttata]|eukprot:XP_012839641.1 PREDICTED: E3 ubiquitin ligase BIG BROTHER-related [Erythranthe guttata]
MADPNSKADAVDTTVRADEEQNPTNNPPTEGDGAAAATAVAAANRPRRTPFTNLSQVDADLALARTLQEQERAYMMLRMDMGEGSDYGSWEAESYEDEDEVDAYDDASEEDYDGSDVEVDDEAEDAFDVHARAGGVESDSQNDEVDPSAFSSDEAYARALQDAEEREMAARLLALAGINDMVVGEDDEEEDDDDDDDGEYDEDEEEHGSNAQDAWEEVDPDELSYEELIALGDVIGTESRGLSADAIASLPSVNYNSKGTHEGNGDSCVICRLDYEDDDNLTVLSCKHLYHPECISNWLNINKVCPVCSAEVSIPGKS